MSVRPDLVACWQYRVGAAGQPEILLLHRAPGEVFPGLWQPVTGKLEARERIVDGALREVVEETGLLLAQVVALYETDIVNWFHAAGDDAVLCETVFAMQVRAEAGIALSHEHDDLRWVTPSAAHELVLWPAYHVAIGRIEWLVANPEQAEAYRLPNPA